MNLRGIQVNTEVRLQCDDTLTSVLIINIHILRVCSWVRNFVYLTIISRYLEGQCICRTQIELYT